MLRALKVLLVLVMLGFLGLVGYAYLGDLTPSRSDRTVPVTLDAN